MADVSSSQRPNIVFFFANQNVEIKKSFCGIQRHENREDKHQPDDGEQHAAHYADGERVPEFFGFPVEKERQQAEYSGKDGQQGRGVFPER